MICPFSWNFYLLTKVQRKHFQCFQWPTWMYFVNINKFWFRHFLILLHFTKLSKFSGNAVVQYHTICNNINVPIIFSNNWLYINPSFSYELFSRLGNPPGENKSNTRQMFNKYVLLNTSSYKQKWMIAGYDCIVIVKLQYLWAFAVFRAVCTVFSTWLSDYPEDFRSLSDPSCLQRIGPLLPEDSSGAEIRGRLLRITEELREKTLLSGSLSGQDIWLFHKGSPSPFVCTLVTDSAGYCVTCSITSLSVSL